MPKQYVMENSSGGRTLTATTQASGPLLHYVYSGATLGNVRLYSGSVTAQMYYLVDNGPTLGRGLSAT